MHPVLFHIGPIYIPSYGVMAAIGVVLALTLALRTARMTHVNPHHMWNLCVIALFSALVGSRLVLVAINWTVLRSHPAWLLSLAMVHHPLVAGIGALFAAVAAVLYARWQHMPPWNTADGLAAPLALGMACEQLGALLAGAGYGTETSGHWGIVYISPFAARWSGTPLGIPLHPVQAYAALAFLTVSIALLVWMPFCRQNGDLAGLWLILAGTAIYFTEFWRDPVGRGNLLDGALDAPQAAAIGLVLAGGWVMRRRRDARRDGNAVSDGTAHA
ncbi:MAG TPA: prolipoprotein diacylglyceryl transferase family protein [Terracidiphilus sp.]|nr:prolipoprotein diacylglyceryl transferase family protein [Terracidiphilus sp.]